MPLREDSGDAAGGDGAVDRRPHLATDFRERGAESTSSCQVEHGERRGERGGLARERRRDPGARAPHPSARRGQRPRRAGSRSPAPCRTSRGRRDAGDLLISAGAMRKPVLISSKTSAAPVFVARVRARAAAMPPTASARPRARGRSPRGRRRPRRPRARGLDVVERHVPSQCADCDGHAGAPRTPSRASRDSQHAITCSRPV